VSIENTQEGNIMALFKRRTEVVPAPAPNAGGSLSTRSGAIVDRATDFYRKNPKTVGGAALVASAVLLGYLKKRGTQA